MKSDQPVYLNISGLDALIGLLGDDGYCVVGPQLRDGAIVYDELHGTDELPRGWIDEQDGGHYRLHREGDAYFGYVVGPQSWKKFLHPPHQPLWRMQKTDGKPEILTEPPAQEKYAFIGVRACELQAIAIQDTVFGGEPYTDPNYQARRERAFLVAVNCARSARTCFCASMGTGPKAESGYDLVLTEISTGKNSGFLAEAGSSKGQKKLERLPSRPASDAECSKAAAIVKKTAASISRSIETEGLPELVKGSPDHPRWEDVSDRCLSCANCTMVCPTCFCTSVEDKSALDGSETVREQRWGSCFTIDFSHIHGGAVRQSGQSRYRQWMTHKLGTWHDQFGTSGCVGCGRCITWCPVGIDITEEAAALRLSDFNTGGNHGD
ncbi:4Fe-4S dicluster domain-containing protein [Hoeflea sp. TYP-13]|uniref:4Fe-4S dicluster domain-containing protein n=1 Tax=Hoeflea sp. TYP-13 TaxID=3230023 RepID=UPI0034C6DB88